jgi:hypothetical protein
MLFFLITFTGILPTMAPNHAEGVPRKNLGFYVKKANGDIFFLEKKFAPALSRKIMQGGECTGTRPLTEGNCHHEIQGEKELVFDGPTTRLSASVRTALKNVIMSKTGWRSGKTYQLPTVAEINQAKEALTAKAN